jgi:NAD+ kinase
VAFLHSQGCEVVVEKDTAAHLGTQGCPVMDVAGIAKKCDLALVVGGDGTMLGFGRQLAPHGIPLIGINQGRLGFITDISLEHMETTLQPMLQGHYEEDQRSMLHAQVWRGTDCVFDALALNDVVINRGATSGMVELRVSVDGHFVANQRADGLIISTPTGSTAYSLSSGGPVVTPDVPVLQLAPICPHSLASRALVFSDSEPVNIYPATPNRMVMVVDGNGGCYVLPEDRIHLERSPYKTRFIRLQSPEFFRILREKLGWGLPHIAKPTSVELP